MTTRLADGKVTVTFDLTPPGWRVEDPDPISRIISRTT